MGHPERDRLLRGKVRRTELKRTGFKRKAPVNTGRKPRPPVKVKSDRRVSEDREYAALRREILKLDDPTTFTYCAAGAPLSQFGIAVCTYKATELHHLRKRSSSGALCNPEGVVPVCSPCNLAIEDHPEEAHGAGLVVREGDPMWDALSSRAWRLR